MTSLPSLSVRISGLTIDNRVLITGGQPWHNQSNHVMIFSCAVMDTIDSRIGYDNIYELDLATEQWTNVGNLLDGRHSHAVSVVRDDLWQYCK